MTIETQTANSIETPSLWQRTLARLSAFEEAMDYDPQQEANASIRRLKTEVAELTARLDEVEGSARRAA